METANLPKTLEAKRLLALASYEIMDTLDEQAYDDITYLAAAICEAPIALMSLVDERRQWFKSNFGLKVKETDRDVAFCTHAIGEPNHMLIVPDALKDKRFVDNPLVTEDPHIRFYAGVVLETPEGQGLGTVCVIDTVPRELTAHQVQCLEALTRHCMAHLNLHRAHIELEEYRKLKKHQLLCELTDTQE